MHYGIIAILLGHLMGLLIPRHILMWNAKPLRLYVLEVFSLAFALMALVGFVGTIERRIRFPKARTVTSAADWIIESMLIVQVVAGIYTAIFYPWGTSWYSTSAVPYLRSIFFFRPDISYLVTTPLIVKFHVVNGWLIVGFFRSPAWCTRWSRRFPISGASRSWCAGMGLGSYRCGRAERAG